VSKTNPDAGDGKSRMTLAALVRGQAAKQEKAAPANPPRLIRLVRPPRPAPASENTPGARGTTDAGSERPDTLGPQSGPAPIDDLVVSDEAFHRAVAAMDEVLRSVRAGMSFSVTIVEAPLGALLENLRTSDLLLLPFFTPRGASAGPAERAVNICVLAMKIATQLDYPLESSLELGLTALLHEGSVGQGPKDEVVRVQGLGARYPSVPEALVQLRERMNGVTPEAGSAETREHVHIVRLAGLIESLVRRKPVRPGFGHSEAIKEILKHERGTYPDKILKALIRVLATLPVGSLVRLNTGEICRVVAKNDDFPLRPIVTVLVRQRKRADEATAIDLSQHPFLHINGFVTEDTLDREAQGGAP